MIGPKTAKDTTISSLAKEVRSTSAAGSSRVRSDGRSREDKYNDDAASTKNRVCSKELILL